MRFLTKTVCAALLLFVSVEVGRADAGQPLTPTKVLSRKNADNTWLTDGGVVQKVVTKGQAQWRFSNWQEYLGDYPELSEFAASRKLDDVREFVSVGPMLVGLFGPYANADNSQRYELHTWTIRGNYAVETLRRNLHFALPQGCSLVTMRSAGPYLMVDGVACAAPVTMYFRIFDDGVVQGPYRGSPDLTADDGVLPESRFWVFDAQGARVIQGATFDESAKSVGIQALKVRLDYAPAVFKSGEPQVQVFTAGSAVIKAGRTVGLGRLSAGARFMWKYYQLPETLADASFRMAGRTNLLLVSRKAGAYDFYTVPSQQMFAGERVDIALPIGGLANTTRTFSGLACTVDGAQAYDGTYAQIATRMPDDTWQLSTDSSAGAVAWLRSDGGMVARIVQEKGQARFEVSRDLRQWTRALGAPLEGIVDFAASGELMMLVGGTPRSLYSSVDGGATWVQLPSPEGYTPMEISLQSEGGRVGAVLFRGDDGSYAFTRTTNGGRTWTAESYIGRGACSGAIPELLTVLDATTMMTRSGVTYDGGRTWFCPATYAALSQQTTTLRVLAGTDYVLVGTQKGLYLTDGLGDGFEKVGFFTGTEISPVREMCGVGRNLILRHDGGFAHIANLSASRQACYKQATGANAGKGGCAYIDQYSVLGARKAMIAAYSNDLVTFKELFRVQADPQFRSPDGYTYALTAAAGGANDILSYLLGDGAAARGAYPDAHHDLSTDQRTALVMAAMNGRTETVKLLLTLGLGDTKPWRGKYGYELAEAAGHVETGAVIREHMLGAQIAEALRQKSIPLFRQAVERFQAYNAVVAGQSILHLAAQTGDVPLCEMLLKGGSDPAARNPQGYYPHESAASVGAQSAAQMLRTALYNRWVLEAYAKTDWPRVAQMVREGADPNLRVEGDLPLVSAAAAAAQNAVIGDIVARAGDLNAMDAAKFLPVDYAIRSGKIETVRLVIANMADKKPALTAPRVAMLLSQKKYDVVDILMTFGADPNGVSLESAKTGDGETILIAAAREGDTQTIELLAKYKANLELPTRAGRTPLMAAAMAGKTAAISTLVRLGAKVDAQDTQGQSALHWATRKQQLSSVQALVLSKANVKLKTTEGDTAEDLADALGFKEIEDYLDSVD